MAAIVVLEVEFSEVLLLAFRYHLARFVVGNGGNSWPYRGAAKHCSYE